MTSLRTSVLVALAVLAFPATASATVGGDTRIEVLGYEAARDLVVMLRCMEGEVETGEGCSLLLLDAESGRVTESRQFAHEDLDARTARLERLRRRLTPMPPVPPGSVTLHRTIERRYRRWVEPALLHMQFMTLRVRVEVDGHTAETHVEAFGTSRVRLRHAARVPGRDAVLVVFDYHGDPFELGYDVDEAVLVR
ncbi:MAG: hypothetical protein M3Y87_04710 [Myxococcota bacterium]|nr:hypothetical protein [Myxococcota bacterium]